MSLDQKLQALTDAECAKAHTHGLILRVASGDGAVDFNGSAVSAPTVLGPQPIVDEFYWTGSVNQNASIARRSGGDM